MAAAAGCSPVPTVTRPHVTALRPRDGGRLRLG